MADPLQLICYTIVGIMLLFTCQALAELAVLYPVNGAFYTYVVRFVDPSWQVTTISAYILVNVETLTCTAGDSPLDGTMRCPG